MPLDINRLITERCDYPLGMKGNPDPMIDATIDNAPDRCFLLTSESLFHSCWKTSEKLRQYFVTAIFDIGAIFAPYTNIKLSVFVLSKKKPKVLKTGRYVGELKSNKKSSIKPNDSIQIKPINPLPSEFLQYCSIIETWVNNGGTTPTDTAYYEFNAVDYTVFDIEIPYSQHYTRQYMTILEKLKTEPVSMLHELAEIISPVADKHSDDGFTLSAANFTYPLNVKNLAPGRSTKTAVKKGDIVFSRIAGKHYLVVDDLKNVYINMNMFIVRAKAILPEYLYVYLDSETGRMIYEASSTGTVIKSITKAALASFPIVIPESQKEYRAVFQAMYVSAGSVDGISRTITSLNKPTDDLQGLFNEETIRKLTLMKDPVVKKIILSDIGEIQTCYKCGAYKATLVLAGSVLEAFLIDWLSEIDGINYFEVDTRNNSEYPSDLAEFINAINAIKKPSWMEEADKAHAIRKKRNVVHAKLCMSQDVQINADTCKMVIEYLIDIISTRYRDLF